MSHDKCVRLRAHEDPELFLESLTFTAAETGFAARLIEKDYFCSVLLQYLWEGQNHQLVFKGGTYLAKVHTGFYRLSEDLDFVIPIEGDISRRERSDSVAEIKKLIAVVPDSIPCFKPGEEFRGTNQSRQYIGSLVYASLVSHDKESIKLEVSLREPLLRPIERQPAKAILLNPVSGQPMVSAIHVSCIEFREAMAEKFRAALTRKEAAIRDFFDIDYAVRSLGLKPNDPDFIALVRKKLSVSGNHPVNVGTERIQELRRQVPSRLMPVLRRVDYELFDLERAFSIAQAMVQT